MMKEKLFADSFCGIGGIRRGFEAEGFKCVWSCDFDKKANITYRVNFNEDSYGDIKKIDPKFIPDHHVFTAGFPCQPFSQAGVALGFEDTRGTLFFDIARILMKKKPPAFFLENVKGLVGHDNGKTFTIMLNTLKNAEYTVYYELLSPHTHGNIPQNRERIFIVGFKKPTKEFVFPSQIPLTKKWRDLIDSSQQEKKYYYTNEKSPSYAKIKQGVVSMDAIYQYRRYYVRENKSGVCPTLTANMGSGGHNVPLILDQWGIRKLTPRECARFQGFPENFVLPDISDSNLYHQIGNSVCIPVVQRIVQQIVKVL
jgi:DNA (cytosine-5)-methyltransferase 1